MKLATRKCARKGTGTGIIAREMMNLRGRKVLPENV
jgi:hypothetical protein